MTIQTIYQKTFADQTEFPILHYVTVTLNTSIEHNFRQFLIPFADADIKINILGIPFFEDYIQNINIQHFTLHNSNINRKIKQMSLNLTLIKRLPIFLINP